MSNQPPQKNEAEGGDDLAPMKDLHALAMTSVETQLQEDFHLLAGNLIDDSGSIDSYRNTSAVMRGYNANLDMLRQSDVQTPGRILVMTRFLTAGKLHDYCLPKDAALLNTENYHPIHGTPLYHQSTVFLKGEVLTKVKELQRDGRKVFTFNTIFSDGEDSEPGAYTVNDARRIVEQMLEMRHHIIAAIGVEGGVDPYAIFRAMGIPERWIKVLPRRNEDIEAGFTASAGHTQTASQSVADFTQTSATGFGQRRPRNH